MAIIGKDVLLGFGDVWISARLKGPVIEPTAQIRFYQLDSPHLDPDPANADPEVIPVTITTSVEALELLNKITSDLLTAIYQRQSLALDRMKERLQTEET